MTKPKSLPPHKLRASIDPEKIPYADSRDIPLGKNVEPPQPRALQALELALRISGAGYNVYVSGPSNLGRAYFVRSFLEPRALKRPTPPDRLYVYNFEDPDRPRALALPSGQGKKLKADLTAAMDKLREEIPARFEQESNAKRRETLARGFADRREDLFGQMEATASGQGFNLSVDDQGGMTLYPLVEGKIVSETEYERLDPALRKSLKARGDELMAAFTELMRKLSQEEKGFRESERSLDREIVSGALAEFVGPVKAAFGEAEAVKGYLEALERDVLESYEQFLLPAGAGQGGAAAHAGQPSGQPAGLGQGLPTGPEGGCDPAFFDRYEVNLLVDNDGLKGAPVVACDHPTYFNLLGCIEREAELGALFTDFSLIKAGALHKANGGFLILRVEDLLPNALAWEGLLRALRSGEARVEDPVDGEGQVRTRTIEPEPIALDVKVVLIGDDEAYEALLWGDDRFRKLFKLKAHLQDYVPRGAQAVNTLLRSLARIIEDEALPPFDRSALAWLADHASRLASDQTKLSLKLPLLRELMIEASALARGHRLQVVDRERLKEAAKLQEFRQNLYEEEFMADYEREIIKVETDGQAVGRANGLSVTYFGDHSFGLPHQIACNVGVGHGGIIDLEREAQLGGPIHTKGMMIIKSCLLRLFAQDKPIVLSGSLCFEQNYAGVEGDSASGAELASLLSALSGAPINLSYAFTGAVSQSGAIMAVGGVNEKIEGFFEVCRRRKLTGRQGVLLPADNVKDLMLKEEVIAAVERGEFHIYPVTSVEEAMELLTGLPAGKRGENGKFPAGTLYRLVDERLAKLAELACQNEFWPAGARCAPPRRPHAALAGRGVEGDGRVGGEAGRPDASAAGRSLALGGRRGDGLVSEAARRRFRK